jgi:hypothetical protein
VPVSGGVEVGVYGAGKVQATLQTRFALDSTDLSKSVALPGVTMHGNCDLCFLKGNNKVMSLISQKPERAIWWAKMESLGLASRPSGFYFRTDRPSYSQMMDYVGKQTDMFAKDDDIACFCGD